MVKRVKKKQRTSPDLTDETGEESSSTLYVLASATLAAAILGLTAFLLIRGFQWRSALHALRAEPGIEILSVERAGFFKKRLRGLRDPLAPTVESILRQHNIGQRSAEILVTEYHSLHTPYAAQREAEEAARFDDLRDSVLTAVGHFAEITTKRREQDLEKITQMLFNARFPEAMKTVSVHWNDGDWQFRGELYAPDRDAFLAKAPEYIIEGKIDDSQLIDLTATRTTDLKQQIETPNLLASNLDDQRVHVDRMVRLVRDYDEVCEHSAMAKPKLRLELRTSEPTDIDSLAPQVAAIRAALTKADHLSVDRFLPDQTKLAPEDSAMLSLKIVSAQNPVP